jgi:drug/metabolite transporter (DMT)-like permease
MEEKRAIDGFGATALIGFAAMLAFNQVVIKVTGGGFGPVFQAGLRSVLGILVLLIWIRLRNVPLAPLPDGARLWGLVAGFLFTFEFTCLFISIDIGSVSRASIMLYSMPVWLALAGHLLLPGERLSGIRGLGLLLAMAGVVLALFERPGETSTLLADSLGLMAAFAWAGLALTVRLTPLSQVPPVTQLMFQLVVSAIVLLAISPLFGPLLRDLQPIHFAGLAFQAICIASLGFMFWFWLLTIYRANAVASFSFLSPVLAVVMGWALLGEQIGVQVWVALALVAAGVFLINRK